MTKTPKNYWKYLSICLIILLSIFTLFQYKLYKNQKDVKERFINHLYFQIDSCVQAIPDNIDAIDNIRFRKINIELRRLDSILYDANMFLDSKIYYGYNFSYNNICTIIEYGKNDCDGFLTDKRISENEFKFLYQLKENLKAAKKNLYSEETKQENPNLTFDDVNDIIKSLYEINEIEISKILN